MVLMCGYRLMLLGSESMPSSADNGFERRLTALEDGFTKFTESRFTESLVHAARMDQQIESMEKSINSIQDEVRSLRRSMIGFALSISGSAIVFAFTVFELLGRSN